MKENENPPAFARVGNEYVSPQDGMTLRDYFAAKAITSLTCAWENLKRTDDDFEKAASHAYRIADAMLAARKEQQ